MGHTNYMMAKSASQTLSKAPWELEEHPSVVERIEDMNTLRELFAQRDHEYGTSITGQIWFTVNGKAYRVPFPFSSKAKCKPYGEHMSFDYFHRNAKKDPVKECPF
jgi:hypothetical protein